MSYDPNGEIKIKDDVPYNSYMFLIPSLLIIGLTNFFYNKQVKNTNITVFIAIALNFCWAGSLIAISFMEAWVKFRSPLVTKQIGVSVGRRVFYGLNLIECTLATGLVCCMIILNKVRKLNINIPYSMYSVIIVLILDVVWLQPNLDLRAREIIAEGTSKSTKLWIHFVYVFGEIVKLASIINNGMFLTSLVN